MEYDYLLKIVFAGDCSVGKTSLLRKYTDKLFTLETKPTIGVEFYTKGVEIDNKIIKLQIWDTSGSDRYRAITHAYYRGAKAVILVYDITRLKTFENLKFWIDEVNSIAPNASKILIGNKCELNHVRAIPTTTGEVFAKANGCIGFLETSVSMDINIDKVFQEISRHCYTKLLNDEYKDENLGNTIKIDKIEPPIIKQKKRCCK
jgi:Ras-related protein Rab-11A